MVDKIEICPLTLTLHELKERFEARHKQEELALRDKSSPYHKDAAHFWRGYKTAFQELGLIKGGF